jgi:hypothetical protein
MPRRSERFPIPDIAGETPEQRFNRVMSALIAVPKAEIAEAPEKPQRTRKPKHRNDLPEIDPNWKKPDWLGE